VGERVGQCEGPPQEADRQEPYGTTLTVSRLHAVAVVAELAVHTCPEELCADGPELACVRAADTFSHAYMIVVCLTVLAIALDPIRSRQFRLDARGVLNHAWFTAHLSGGVIAADMGDRITGYNNKYRRKLKASIYGSMFIAGLLSVSARSQTRCGCCVGRVGCVGCGLWAAGCGLCWLWAVLVVWVVCIRGPLD
jgi:hypothetical protein